MAGEFGSVQLEGARSQTAALLQRRRTIQRDVAAFYARRFQRNQLVPQGAPGTGPVEIADFEKVVLQKDNLNVVGDHGSQTPGLREVEITRDTDGGMRWWADPEVQLTVKNTSGVSIAAGTPVYATGSVGATSVVEIAAADAGNAAKMPAIGLVETTLAPNDFGSLMVVGVIRQVNTGSYSINQTLYVANGGGLTGTRPTATTQLVQNIGRVVRVNASTGEILVYGAGRTNDVPNYGQGKLLGRGSASGAGPAEEITLGSGLTLTGTTLTATGGGGGASGVTTVDFGAFPGASDAFIAVDEPSVTNSSVIQAWIVAQETADHSADEHRVETISVMAGDLVDGVGFTIYAQNTSQLNEPLREQGNNRDRNALTITLGGQTASIGGQGTRLYGAWTVAWRWS